jgi:hypothetical protein
MSIRSPSLLSSCEAEQRAHDVPVPGRQYTIGAPKHKEAARLHSVTVRHGDCREVLRRCPMCRKAFRVAAARLKHGRGIHCSRACQYEANRSKLAKPVMCVCIGCGDAFMSCPSKLASKRGAGKYCTRACRDAHWRGSLNPNWQNAGKTHPKGPAWYAVRRRVIARDKCCQVCGSAGQLHVHHSIPFRLFDDADEANAESNLIALCPPCHRREEARWKWAQIPDGGGVIMMNAGGIAWQLAREQGLL